MISDMFDYFVHALLFLRKSVRIGLTLTEPRFRNSRKAYVFPRLECRNSITESSSSHD